ncbi:MAG TPA: YggT family protein [Candidatus Saccharimonadales bacterium]|nr:YggT family protein [Candidatus Saccharimonadales bacterium]
MVYAIFGFISLAVGLRFVLLLVGASAASPFVSWIYTWSDPFVRPFAGIFGQSSTAAGQGVATQSIFDWTALIALVAYLLIAAILGHLVTRPHYYHYN